MKRETKTFKRLMGTILFLHLFLVFTVLGNTQETYPTKPIISVIPYPAGGATDLACRALGIIAPKYFRQPLVPTNKVGSMGVAAAIFTAQEKPDGYTIAHLAPPPFATVPYVFDVAFDPSSLKPVIGWTQYPFFMAVRGDAPWKNLDEFISYARSHPGLKYSHSGPAAFPHLAMESIAKVSGIKITGVPFKGDADQTIALLGGHVSASCATSGLKPLIDSGKVRILGMFTKERVKGYDAPTIKEQGYETGLYAPFVGGFVHKDTPEAIVKQLHDNIRKIMEDPEFVVAMDKIAMPISYISTHDFAERIKKEIETSQILLRELGLLKKGK
jgi:tripartite-type tricarboxylate transporter receptor subunit TctC